MTGSGAVQRVARALMYAGLSLAVTAALAWWLNLLPALPEWMIRLALFKLALGSGAAMVLAGAAVGRAARESNLAARPDAGDVHLDGGTAESLLLIHQLQQMAHPGAQPAPEMVQPFDPGTAAPMPMPDAMPMPDMPLPPSDPTQGMQ